LSNFCDNKIFFYFFFAICNFQYIFAPHLNRKNKKMKKISFAFAAVALFAFAACSNGTETAPGDSTANNDSNVAAPVDTMANDSNANDSNTAAAPVAAPAAAPAAH
jgi:outer membrane murein-binding lipoprotein Lpp